MRLHSPSMSELHAFVTVVRTGSFSRAAEELCVTQGAISRAVARLEGHYGKVLLRRSAHQMVLTQSGAQLLEAVREPLAAIEAASEALRVGPSQTTELVLSVVPTLASVWLVPRLPDFQARHPQVRVRFVPYRKDEDFSGPTPHAAILTGLGPSQWPAWECDYLIGREVVPVCHPARAARQRWQHPADLMAESLLAHSTSPGNWAHWLHAAGAGEVVPELSTVFDQVSILIQAAMADMGVALVQRCLVRAELDAGRLVAPFDLPITLPRGYFLCSLPGRHMAASLPVFRQWLLEMAREDIASMPS
ncbi:MAG: LysR substrate-binding domain-containing protein [Acidovorax sp.]|uniref:LysR substrate-binding domain-containing protein n=1 Tax=unclassified Acidovorax TaxID=2684926 RepID=UPI0022BF2AD7|nr:LysR substrate-binding domain-containing protein [Acidovorax sp.]MCZ8221128.1 LysR substrate-binding domain-containing protein [Acidovorax sp.]